jgi:hypothetical protein
VQLTGTACKSYQSRGYQAAPFKALTKKVRITLARRHSLFAWQNRGEGIWGCGSFHSVNFGPLSVEIRTS